MNMQLKTDLADSLKRYSTYVDYWEPGAGDSQLLLGHREFLQLNLQDLTAAQRETLSAADQRVMTLAQQRYEDENDDDVLILRLCAEVIQKNAI
jgi:hypothetical protein